MSVQKQIRQRISDATRKGIREQVEQVTKRFGSHTTPSYQDSGETFHEDNWEFQSGKLKLNCHISYFGHCTLMVYWRGKNVFEAASDSVKPERTIKSYIPGIEWETALKKLNKPIGIEKRKEREAAARELKKRFGLS